MSVIQKTVVALEKVYSMDGCSVMQNGGAFCDFGHCHFHVFPRYKGDGFGWKYPEGAFACSKNVSEKIREAVSGIDSGCLCL